MDVLNRVLLVLLAVSLNFSVACRNGTAGVTELPPPEQRPAGSPPEPPRASVELPPQSKAAPTRVLKAGDDLQSALDEAKAGDVIALEAGAVFTGAFRLPNKPGNGWITIRTRVADGVFPQAGTRVDPSQSRLMPVIQSDSDRPAITAAPGAHHYHFIGIELRPKAGVFSYNVVLLGSNEKDVESLPHHFSFDRCYIHGDPQLGGRRGIALNSRHTAIVDSYLADFKEQGNDAQAICGWNGTGPFAIVNNYLEGAGENLMFGGGDPTILNLIPSDIEIRGNRISKPLAWKGSNWTVKNLFELKNARRVVVEGNLFENNWLQSQNGFAILFTPRNQDGGAPWCGVTDVAFNGNTVRHTSSGVNILGNDDIHESQQTRRIQIRENLFEDVDGTKWGGEGILFQIIEGAADIVIDHNTALQSGSVLVGNGAANSGVVFTNNLAKHNAYGVGGRDLFGNPMQALARYFPQAIFAKNVLIGNNAHLAYPADNFFPSTAAEVGFKDFAAGNYRLTSASRFEKAGTDGKAIGADLDAPPVRRKPSNS
jgi:hypothetical protein